MIQLTRCRQAGQRRGWTTLQTGRMWLSLAVPMLPPSAFWASITTRMDDGYCGSRPLLWATLLGLEARLLAKTCWVTLGQWLPLSGPQFPSLQSQVS